MLRLNAIPLCARAGLVLAAALLLSPTPTLAQAKVVQTPYQNPKALVDIFLDDPAKLGAALYWVRSFVNPLTEAPYSMFPEDIKVIVLLHGTEIVALAKKNAARYEEVLQRMRYYAEMGVKFRVCGLALQDYGYTPADMQDFVEVAPSAITELVHWQNQGYALVPAIVQDKKFSIEQIR
ncbi:MAG: DsrE family protein [Hylemonella sp.]|uniref:DsrE family protein n=1 Tax=Hylemonella sp. TaxID=2066020 RepID=UPI0022BB1B16|nr:DsrE family protein [Hylemonella sp.]MCZ8252498.1 DsrE family protein [Hylemonella sp.]